jgi:lipopolysaccharide transport system ATP-binding protein
LLIDEVLAVGDLRFRAKCYRKLAELKKLNTTFIMVSHSPQSILSICDVGMYLKKGVLIGFGSTADIMNQYEVDLSKLDLKYINNSRNDINKKNIDLKVAKIFFEDENANEILYPHTGKATSLALMLESERDYNNINIQMAVSDSSLYGERILFFNNLIDDVKIAVVKGSNQIKIQFPYLGLNPGLYTLKVSVYQDELHLLDTVEAFNFVVKSDFPARQSLFYQSRQWLVLQNNILN